VTLSVQHVPTATSVSGAQQTAGRSVTSASVPLDSHARLLASVSVSRLFSTWCYLSRHVTIYAYTRIHKSETINIDVQPDANNLTSPPQTNLSKSDIINVPT